MSGEGMGLWTPDKWSASRKYQMTKRQTWQECRSKFYDSINHQHTSQQVAKAWKDAYDIGFKEIDDGNVVST